MKKLILFLLVFAVLLSSVEFVSATAYCGITCGNSGSEGKICTRSGNPDILCKGGQWMHADYYKGAVASIDTGTIKYDLAAIYSWTGGSRWAWWYCNAYGNVNNQGSYGMSMGWDQNVPFYNVYDGRQYICVKGGDSWNSILECTTGSFNTCKDQNFVTSWSGWVGSGSPLNSGGVCLRYDETILGWRCSKGSDGNMLFERASSDLPGLCGNYHCPSAFPRNSISEGSSCIAACGDGSQGTTTGHRYDVGFADVLNACSDIGGDEGCDPACSWKWENTCGDDPITFYPSNLSGCHNQNEFGCAASYLDCSWGNDNQCNSCYEHKFVEGNCAWGFGIIIIIPYPYYYCDISPSASCVAGRCGAICSDGNTQSCGTGGTGTKYCSSTCDWSGPCTGCGNGVCETGENCAADVGSCLNNMCKNPTCTNGCGETLVASGGTDEACTATAGCASPPCVCNGAGSCALQCSCTGTSCGTGANAGKRCDGCRWQVVSSVAETCNGVDDNCDGTVDNGLTGDSCPLTLGVCAGSKKTCGGAAGWQTCTAANYGPNYQAIETTCDGLNDNDCDGSPDSADSDCDVIPPKFTNFSISGCITKNDATKECFVQPGTKIYAAVNYTDSESGLSGGLSTQYLSLTKGCIPGEGTTKCNPLHPPTLSFNETRSQFVLSTKFFNQDYKNSTTDFANITNAGCLKCDANNASIKWNISALKEGNLNIWAKMQDSIGNPALNNTYWTLKIDGTLPFVNITSPAAGALLQTNFYLNYTATDANIYTCALKTSIQPAWKPVDCGINKTVVITAIGTGTDCGNGPSCVVDVNATDKAGNSYVKSITFTNIHPYPMTVTWSPSAAYLGDNAVCNATYLGGGKVNFTIEGVKSDNVPLAGGRAGVLVQGLEAKTNGYTCTVILSSDKSKTASARLAVIEAPEAPVAASLPFFGFANALLVMLGIFFYYVIKENRKSVSKKGVSPLIATVLLVVIAIALGGIVFAWVRSFVKENVEKMGGAIETICQSIAFDATASRTAAGITINVNNQGNIPLYGMNVKMWVVGGKSYSKFFKTASVVEGGGTGEINILSGDNKFLIPGQGSIKFDITPVILGKGVNTGKGRIHLCKQQMKTVNL